MIEDAIERARTVHRECTCGGHFLGAGVTPVLPNERCRCHFHVEELLAVAGILQEENARLKGIFADLCQDSPPVQAAFAQGKVEGSLIGAKLIQDRIEATIASWKAPPGPGERIPDDADLVIAAMEVLKTCISHRGVTREESLARARSRPEPPVATVAVGLVSRSSPGAVFEAAIVGWAGHGEFPISVNEIVSYDERNRRLMVGAFAGLRRFVVQAIHPDRQTIVLVETRERSTP